MELKMIELLQKFLPEKTGDLNEVYLLKREIIADLIDKISDKIILEVKERNFEVVHELTDLSESLSNEDNKLEEILLRFGLTNRENFIKSKKIETKNEIVDKPNYEDFQVDNLIEHSLEENFTFKRPAGYLLNGKKYQVSTFTEILVGVANFLLEMDAEKLYDLESNKRFVGRTRKSFSQNPAELTDPRLLDDGKMYIKTQLSSNSIGDFIKKLLKEFEIDDKYFRIYFRADYTNMH